MEVTPSAVMRQVDRIVGSNSFRNAERLRAFLTFVVQEALAGRQNEIKEYSIGREVCGRPASFDPKADSIVRVDANRLRSRLQTYYQTEGVSDEVVIELPKGSYIPVFKWTMPSEPTQPGPSSLAVLPFVNLSGTNDHDYFADSLTEELIHALSRLDGLHVIARSSVFQFKGRTDDGCGLGKRLRVDHVLEGSVLLAGSRLRVTAQLIDVRHGWVLWSEKYESDWKDIFMVQDEITASITDALKMRLNPKAASELFTHATEDSDAYADYLRGRYYWNQRTPAALSASIRFYERALERDAKCAPAYAGIADTLSVMALNDQEPTFVVTPRARPKPVVRNQPAGSDGADLGTSGPAGHSTACIISTRTASFPDRSGCHAARVGLGNSSRVGGSRITFIWGISSSGSCWTTPLSSATPSRSMPQSTTLGLF